jgi:hypothetical protein
VASHSDTRNRSSGPRSWVTCAAHLTRVTRVTCNPPLGYPNVSSTWMRISKKFGMAISLQAPPAVPPLSGFSPPPCDQQERLLLPSPNHEPPATPYEAPMTQQQRQQQQRRRHAAVFAAFVGFGLASWIMTNGARLVLAIPLDIMASLTAWQSPTWSSAPSCVCCPKNTASTPIRSVPAAAPSRCHASANALPLRSSRSSRPTSTRSCTCWSTTGASA